MVTRREVLKAAAVGYPTLDLIKTALRDETFEVAVFLSRGTYRYYEREYGDGFYPADKIQRWVEGVFNHERNPYEVTVQVGQTVVDPPTEEPLGEGTGYEVTDEDGETWRALAFWWENYHRNQNADLSAPDSNILLTTGGGGMAVGEGNHAVAGRSDYWDTLPEEYQQFGDYIGYEAVQNLIHELGHNLLTLNTHYILTAVRNQDELPPLDTEYEGIRGIKHEMMHHDLGTVVSVPGNPGDYAITPMRYGPGESNCSCSDYADRDANWYANFYAPCTLAHISK